MNAKWGCSSEKNLPLFPLTDAPTPTPSTMEKKDLNETGRVAYLESTSTDLNVILQVTADGTGPPS